MEIAALPRVVNVAQNRGIASRDQCFVTFHEGLTEQDFHFFPDFGNMNLRLLESVFIGLENEFCCIEKSTIDIEEHGFHVGYIITLPWYNVGMFVSVGNTKIHYETSGKGPNTLVFVHGWGGSHKSLKKLAQKASRTWKTVIFDLPGFGKSDNPDPSWGVPDYARLVTSFLEAINVKEAVYFGHSFGGSLGIYIVANNLFPVRKLILCASSYKRSGKKSKVASGMNSVVNNFFPFLSDVVTRIKPILYKVFFRKSDLAKYPHLETNFRKIVTHDLTPLLEQINVPTLIVWGGRDTYTPVGFADELNTKIIGSQKIIFPHKSHNLPIKYPDDVWKELKAFLG